jgi:hypothetical protein
VEGHSVSTWVIPYSDQSLDFWEEVHHRYGEEVKEVYFPMPEGRLASGRSLQPDRYLGDFLRRAPLTKSVLANPIVWPEPNETVGHKVVAALRQLRDEFGVQSVTVASLTLARSIKEALPEYCVTASVLMGIASPFQALVAGDWVDAIAPDTSLVRDMAGLQRLRAAFRGEIRLLVNEACLPRCPFRTQHFYEMAYSDSFPKSLCDQVLDERPWLRLTGAWILPRHLDLYDELYDSLKLAGRVTLQDPDRYLTVLEAYVKRGEILPTDIGGGPASPLEPFDVSDEWFEYVLHCDKRCDVCSVCREHYELINQQQEVEGS